MGSSDSLGTRMQGLPCGQTASLLRAGVGAIVLSVRLFIGSWYHLPSPQLSCRGRCVLTLNWIRGHPQERRPWGSLAFWSHRLGRGLVVPIRRSSSPTLIPVERAGIHVGPTPASFPSADESWRAVTLGTVCGHHLESHLSQLTEDFRVWAATQASLILKELE